jgi:hypothetical protein
MLSRNNNSKYIHIWYIDKAKTTKLRNKLAILVSEFNTYFSVKSIQIHQKPVKTFYIYIYIYIYM